MAVALVFFLGHKAHPSNVRAVSKTFHLLCSTPPEKFSEVGYQYVSVSAKKECYSIG